ncbi:MAG: sigma 54-interacting transcriptional regulator, partial [Cohaesibacter sp.]|nr:sigma 54-interacting transcriptional regulator [Cohaesibacter sp.]
MLQYERRKQCQFAIWRGERFFWPCSAARRGLLEEAHNSTLFLDEICDLDISMQALLLRFLERRETSRLGSQQVQQLDCHIIACTNQDLSAHIKKGLFRQDLYYRLAGFELTLPALRDRLEDLPILARRLLD